MSVCLCFVLCLAHMLGPCSASLWFPLIICLFLCPVLSWGFFWRGFSFCLPAQCSDSLCVPRLRFGLTFVITGLPTLDPCLPYLLSCIKACHFTSSFSLLSVLQSSTVACCFAAGACTQVWRNPFFVVVYIDIQFHILLLLNAVDFAHNLCPLFSRTPKTIRSHWNLTSAQNMKAVSRAHILQGFQQHCQALSKENNAGYSREFEELNNVGLGLATTAGQLHVNKGKNRYPQILPYDHCRVRLALLNSQLHSDYINASYVPGGASAHDFICTQGPLRSTRADFWRMVWEQNVRVIIMVTACIENRAMMCEPYWPQERVSVCYGAVQVTTLYQQRGPDSIITTMHLRQAGSPAERRITHYQYPGWPDQGVPENLVSLCAFAELIRKHLNTLQHIGPTIVHCSAGVGRSGALVALLWLMQLCVRGVPPDVRAVVYDLRRHRVMMVQNLEQYIFVHDCLKHWLTVETSGHRPRGTQESRGPPPDRERDTRRSSQEGHSSSAHRSRGDHERSHRHPQQHRHRRKESSNTNRLGSS
ncbi:receptor-type tyrosine-protein phosphatase V-like isoform X2 [Conger conger]|uniref:receptor-type tyrosine-protein phosphatase V-like isoform X2 n=2 Tax=Conger conger TaxID=82655 RepID=UPI002A5AAABC|nr:receptor-type tyrosine-protein phosphatase V-like isoform X2 [Conger conger]